MTLMTTSTTAPGLPFTKGHGTQNDFVLVPDLDGTRDLSADLVRRLADRRSGIGGDGVIRVVRTAHATEPQVQALAGQADWFMDYRNADGSVAQMCGNGTRVFAAYLAREGLETRPDFAIATRAGISLGLTYRYFARKEELVAALYEQLTVETEAAIQTLLAETYP